MLRLDGQQAILRRLVLVFLAAGLPVGAAAEPAVGAKGQIQGLISEADYPPEALRNGEQGTVRFRLFISPRGSVTGCRVTASSGSGTLDRETCRLIRERARFTPARDRRGRAVADTASSSVQWHLSTLPMAPPEIQASAEVWMTCLRDAAEPRLATADTAEAIVQKAFDAYTAQEEALAAVSARILPDPVPAGSDAMRSGIRAELIKRIAAARAQMRPNR